MTHIRRHKTLTRARHFIVAVLLCICLPPILLASYVDQQKADEIRVPSKDSLPEIAPQIPKADRNTDKRVFLERADRMSQAEHDTFVVVTGNVEFSHGAMLMYCDSAHFYLGSQSLDAFGDVRMRQGDTLFVYADELNYDGTTHIAYLYGNPGEPVKMINRDVTLLTPTFIYDLSLEYGYYNEGGELYDRQNRLTSDEGEYTPATKDANFYGNVVLNSRSENDTLTIYTENLIYNTQTHVAELFTPSEIISGDGTIYTSNGTYNTESQYAELYDRSTVVASTGTTLMGDTLIYDRNLGLGEAYGNMEIVDTAHCIIFTGEYGYYNEVVDSAFATGRALGKYYNEGDTLYLHGRYLYSFSVRDTIEIPEDTIMGIESQTRIDTTHVMVAHPRVRFYRSDMQGLCDSMRFEERDTMLYMYHHPVIWSGERQVFGNIIQLHLNDSTIERASLPDFGFTAEHVDSIFYNQMAGKEMIAYFVDGDMRHLDVNGNVQAIMLPMENDSTYNKIVNVESSFMSADFLNREILRMKMWPETNGTVTPLYLARKGLFYLPQFKWYTSMRPTSPLDVFVIPKDMEILMEDIPTHPVQLPESYMRWRRDNADDLESIENNDNIENNDTVDNIDTIDTIENTENNESIEEIDTLEKSPD